MRHDLECGDLSPLSMSTLLKRKTATSRRTPKSCLPLTNEIRDRAQELCGPLNAFKRTTSRAMHGLEVRVRGFNSVESRISSFERARIFSRSFAQVFGRGGHIQKIVRDLKQQAQICRVFSNRCE